MQTNNHKIVDYDAVLDAKFGKEGTKRLPILSIRGRYFRTPVKRQK